MAFRADGVPMQLAGTTLLCWNMHLRQATAADVLPIMQLVRRVVPLMRAQGNLQWDDNYPNAGVFAQDIAQGQLWVAQTEKAASSIAGVAAMTTEQEPEYAAADWDYTQPALVVHRLAVDPELRGLGIAGALMRQAEAIAQARGILFVRVDTNSENSATQRLFPKLGYRPAGEIALRFRPGLRFLCYEKQVSLPQGRD